MAKEENKEKKVEKEISKKNLYQEKKSKKEYFEWYCLRTIDF